MALVAASTPAGYGSGMPVELTNGEASTWRLIQRLSDLATGIVEQQIKSAADLSSAEFDVLRCLVEAEHGRLRQAELAGSLGWDKSRLSHQLTRMAHRELIERQKSGRIHGVTITRSGVQKFEMADGAHVAAVRILLQEHLSTAEREALQRTAVLEQSAAREQPAVEVEPAPERAAARPLRLRPRTS